VTVREAKQRLDRLAPLLERGAIPEQRLHEVKAELAKAEAEERAATARLERLRRRPFKLEVAELEAKVAGAKEAVAAAEAELEHYVVTAPIDGVVSRLDVCPGAVDRPGTTVWGEVLDLSVIDVRCDVSPEQADQVAVGQAAEAFRAAQDREGLPGQVVMVGIAADPQTGKVPVLVRLKNGEKRLRCNVEVKVRFGRGTPAGTAGRE
jgi:multidrug resistance efflux pump